MMVFSDGLITHYGKFFSDPGESSLRFNHRGNPTDCPDDFKHYALKILLDTDFFEILLCTRMQRHTHSHQRFFYIDAFEFGMRFFDLW